MNKKSDCALCDFKCSNVSVLKKHYLSNHSEDLTGLDYLFKEPKCEKGEEKNYNCDSCEKSFAASANLKRHIKTVHEGQMDYKCVSCGKSFTQSGNLKNHIKTIHEGQKNYTCPHCKQAFYQKSNFERHVNKSSQIIRVI